ncbi:MAG: hypothetical protein L0Y54_09995, partial [Sporichthyaceae bacterium]|nr:hypothetical protein [Sporichthyaceae bacterium]
MRLALLSLLVAATVEPGPAVHAQRSRYWRPDERVVITDYSQVDALAATSTLLFVATRNGLAVYDHRGRTWAQPVTIADGYPTTPVNAALADPIDESLWLATVTGLVHYRPHSREFESAIPSGGVTELMLDADDPFRGIYLRGAFGWQFLARGSIAPMPADRLPAPGRRIGTLPISEALARYPQAQAMSAGILTDPGRSPSFGYRFTSAAVVPETEQVFFGTSGLGVVRMDVLVTRFERLPFGLLGAVARRIVAVPDGVWVGADQGSGRPGFTFIADDLQQFRYEDFGRTGRGFRVIYDLLWRGRELWVATDQGVANFEPGEPVRIIGTAEGLPDATVVALAQGPGGIWAGTRRGLAHIADDGSVIAWDDQMGLGILALAGAGDTVWVGTAAGLGVATSSGEGVMLPAESAGEPVLRRPIVAVTLSADTVVIATDDRIAWRPPGGAWVVERVLASQIGRITSLAGDPGGTWVG